MSRKREEKIQPADFHTYANIQKAMCIKNPATEGGKDILWRIYKKNRFRELFLSLWASCQISWAFLEPLIRFLPCLPSFF